LDGFIANHLEKCWKTASDLLQANDGESAIREALPPKYQISPPKTNGWFT